MFIYPFLIAHSEYALLRQHLVLNIRQAKNIPIAGPLSPLQLLPGQDDAASEGPDANLQGDSGELKQGPFPLN